MIISDETVFLSLAVGVILGVFYLVNKLILARYRKSWLLIFISDFTFIAMTFMLTFVISIPINNGRIRFAQVALEVIGALAFTYTLGDLIYIILLSSTEKLKVFKKTMNKTMNSRIKRQKNGENTRKT